MWLCVAVHCVFVRATSLFLPVEPVLLIIHITVSEYLLNKLFRIDWKESKTNRKKTSQKKRSWFPEEEKTRLNEDDRSIFFFRVCVCEKIPFFHSEIANFVELRWAKKKNVNRPYNC